MVFVLFGENSMPVFPRIFDIVNILNLLVFTLDRSNGSIFGGLFFIFTSSDFSDSEKESCCFTFGLLLYLF
jgi:hypothetical protein